MFPTKFQKGKIDFQDGRHGSHLGFSIETILSIFYLQVNPMLPTEFQVNWPFGSGEKGKIRFSRWPSWRGHLGFLIGTILAIFDHQIPMLPTKF